MDKTIKNQNATAQVAYMLETNEILLKTVRRVEEAIARIDRDMEKDRQELQNLIIQGKEFKAELVELRKAVNQSASRAQDKVAEAIEPIINSTDKLTAQVKKSKMVVVKEKLNWIQRLFGGFKNELRKEVTE